MNTPIKGGEGCDGEASVSINSKCGKASTPSPLVGEGQGEGAIKKLSRYLI